MVLPAGTNDLSRVDTTTRCIAVVMNNDQGPFTTWQNYRVSVDSVEALTGLDFFSNVPVNVQAVIEAKVDNQP
jgi:endonuclease G